MTEDHPTTTIPNRKGKPMNTSTSVATKRNGSLPVEPPQPLPEHRQKAVEMGLAFYQKAAADLEEANRKLNEMIQENSGLKVQIDSLKGVVNLMESSYKSSILALEERCKKYQDERDMAVSSVTEVATKWEGLYVGIASLMKSFNVPSSPSRLFANELMNGGEHHEIEEHIQEETFQDQNQG